MRTIDKYIASIDYIRDYLVACREIMDSGCCNDCSKMRVCEYMPEVGKLVRYNCPFYEREGNKE